MVKMLECISPIDGHLYATRPIMSRQEIENAIMRAKKAQKQWKTRHIRERISLLKAATAKIGEETDRMTQELAYQIGRPVRYGGEFKGFDERVQYMANIAQDALAPIVIEDDERFVRKIEREPCGIVLVIAPWNYPYMTAINTIAPAIIAGNAILLKHATQTLLVGEHLTQAFHGAGIPHDLLQNLFMDHQMTNQLIASGEMDFINFTGSVEAGRTIERSAAGTFTGVGTELGGKDPAYLCEDAHLDAAVETLIDGAMYNSGQCCCGIERIYVHEMLYEDFVDKAVALTRNYKLGNPLKQETTLGPMAHTRFARLVRAHIQEAIRAGATAHIRNFPEDDGDAYLTPQILTNVTHDMRVMREETFGPVVGIMPVKDDQEAIALMNDSAFGLTASIWTQDVEKAQTLGRQIETGTVFMNRADYLDPALCWTGCKNTGRGGTLSVIGYHTVTRPKSYHLKKDRAHES